MQKLNWNSNFNVIVVFENVSFERVATKWELYQKKVYEMHTNIEDHNDRYAKLSINL